MLDKSFNELDCFFLLASGEFRDLFKAHLCPQTNEFVNQIVLWLQQAAGFTLAVEYISTSFWFHSLARFFCFQSLDRLLL
jgi:hypothetical protein